MDDATIFTMAEKGATLEDLRRVEGKAELVNGEIVRMTPAGYRHGRVAGRIFQSLLAHEGRSGVGVALGDSVGFRVDLPRRQSFSPDVAYYVGDPPADEEDFAEGAPIFAAEIRSKDDYSASAEARLSAKRADYFTAGTLVVWDVNPRTRSISVYRAARPTEPEIFHHTDVINAEPALPGWTVAVAALFPEERRSRKT